MDKDIGAYRTISEVAEDLDLPQHVLRFWETRFPQIKPMKRSGGRRYYRPLDVLLLRGIRQLLYGQGYTIKGVQRILTAQGVGAVQQIGGASAAELSVAASLPADARSDGGRASGGQDDAADNDAAPDEIGGAEAAADEDSSVEEREPARATDRPVDPRPARTRATPVLDQKHLLRTALDELVECGRLLSALNDTETGSSGPEHPP
jgi:DNA-binding transcriptional MerR regulator